MRPALLENDAHAAALSVLGGLLPSEETGRLVELVGRLASTSSGPL
jgi:hypothetical protein